MSSFSNSCDVVGRVLRICYRLLLTMVCCRPLRTMVLSLGYSSGRDLVMAWIMLSIAMSKRLFDHGVCDALRMSVLDSISCVLVVIFFVLGQYFI